MAQLGDPGLIQEGRTPGIPVRPLYEQTSGGFPLVFFICCAGLRKGCKAGYALSGKQEFKVWRYTTISDLMVNGQIRDREVRLIGADGEQLGIMSAREALRIAQEAELDLVKISPKANPPVCKIVDYGKYKYDQSRREKEAKKKQKTVELKEVRLSPNIDTNDMNTKVNNAKKFIAKGNRVKVTLRFRGREMAHVQQTKHILDDFAAMLQDVAVVEKPAKMEGRSMSIVLVEKR